MKISRVIINNYRNIRNIDICLSDIVAIIGENNSGKSNLLRAITLPLLSEDRGAIGKNLSWNDINRDAKNEYYNFLIKSQNEINSGVVTDEQIIEQLPIISVELHFEIESIEGYYVKDLTTIINNDIAYILRYEFKPLRCEQIISTVKSILKTNVLDDSTIKSYQMNLLQTDYYSYSVITPNKGSVSYDVLKSFRYTSLEAERDDFSRKNSSIGSKSLVKLLKAGLSNKNKLDIESEYMRFFTKLKEISNMEQILNWHESTDLVQAKKFFEHITIQPNIPPMTSLFNSVQLGYLDDEMSLQGLGYRNLILLFILINSLLDEDENIAFTALTLEEPEAHLCINNIKILVSFLNVFATSKSRSQLFYSTHHTEFINKMNLKNVVVMHDGCAYSFKEELDDAEMDYLTKNPNLDLFKLFFSKKCIIFEGITEEMLIRAYIQSRKELNDIELITFHKGFKNIINIWKKVNYDSRNKLGIIRDYDNEKNAKFEHDQLDDGIKICVRTTNEYTLETEIVYTGNNYKLLMETYSDRFDWNDLNKEQLQQKWRESKSDVMLEICKDIISGKLSNLELPRHIKEVLEFLNGE